MKPRYPHMSLGQRIGPPRGLRVRGGGLRRLCDLEKFQISHVL